MNYNEVIQRKVRSLASAAAGHRELYSYSEPDLDRAFAFSGGHSTAKRPNLVTTLPQNFPLFSSLQSTRAGFRRSTTSAQQQQQQVLVDLDYAMHVLETLTFFVSPSGAGAGAGAGLTVLLLGEWTRAERALEASGLLSPNDVLRAVAQPPHPLTSESDWIRTLQAWRAEIPLQRRLVVFFDQPCAASHPADLAAHAKLQLVMLYLLHPDAALLRFSLPPGKASNRLYPAGRLVLPMADDPQVEQLLLFTTASEYDARMEIYPAAKIRDQFAYFARETVPRVDYRDLTSGTRTTYLARRQQDVLFAARRARADSSSTATTTTNPNSGDDRWWTSDAPMVPVSCVELGGTDGYLAVVATTLGGEADDDNDVDDDHTSGRRVEMLHVRTWTRVSPRELLGGGEDGEGDERDVVADEDVDGIMMDTYL